MCYLKKKYLKWSLNIVKNITLSFHNIQDSLPYVHLCVLHVVVSRYNYLIPDESIVLLQEKCYQCLKLLLCNKTSKARRNGHGITHQSAWTRQSTPAGEWIVAADDFYRATPRFCDTGPRCWGLVRLYDRTLSNVNTCGELCKIFTDTKEPHYNPAYKSVAAKVNQF